MLVRDGSSRCEKHRVAAWSIKSQASTKRITGRRLQAMRLSLFSREPLCAECKSKGIASLATIRDHKVPLAEGGKDDETNEQGLCEPCHDVKSKGEARRGRGV